MPFFLPVDFESALPENINGRLSSDQLKAIGLMLRSRKTTGYILFFCALFQAAIAVPVFFYGEWQASERVAQIIVGIYAAVNIVCTLWGAIIVKQAAGASKKINELAVQSVSGTPNKYNYATTYRAFGATHLFIVNAGWVSINKVGYGVLPGPLYGEIPANEESLFHYVRIPALGFKKNIIVNFV